MGEEKSKKLKLKPSLREKNRYLLFEYIDNGKNVKEIINKAILDFIGVFGYAKACPKVLKFKKHGSNMVGVLAIKRGELDKIKAALISSGIKIKRISGTLKKLEQ